MAKAWHQSCMAAGSVHWVPLTVAPAWLCARCVNETGGQLPDTNILKANTHTHTKPSCSQKGSPFRGWGALGFWSQVFGSAEPHCVSSGKACSWQRVHYLSHCPSKGISQKNPVSNSWARLSNPAPGRGEISNTGSSSQLGPEDGELCLVLLVAEAHRNARTSCRE